MTDRELTDTQLSHMIIDWKNSVHYSSIIWLCRKAIAADRALRATPAPAQPEGQSADVDEMAAWMRRLVRALRKAAPGNALAEKALDDLKLRGLLGDVLREAEEPNPLNVANERGEGWQVVPTQPTKEMIDAGSKHTSRDNDEEPYRARGEAIAVYMDMLAAAPEAGAASPAEGTSNE